MASTSNLIIYDAKTNFLPFYMVKKPNTGTKMGS